MVVLLFILALSFFMAGHVESIVFDKNLGELQLWKTSLYCTKDLRRYPLDDIHDVKAYKEGHMGINVYTLHFKIMILFKDGNYEPVKVLETALRNKCIKQVSVIIANPSSDRHVSSRTSWAGSALKGRFISSMSRPGCEVLACLLCDI